MKGQRVIVTAVLAVAMQMAYAFTPSTNLWAVIDTYRAITDTYVDTVNEAEVEAAAIRGMLKELDPHSTYITVEELSQANEAIDGNFEGIGISYRMIEDTLTVLQTITGCPAEKVGIRPGDKVVSVNDTTIAGVKMNSTKIAKLIRGPRGSVVDIGVKRAGFDEEIHFMVTRDKIPVNTLDVAYRIDDKTVYILLNSFGRKTMHEIYNACDSLKLWDAENVILDLQDNGGGLLQTALYLADEFLAQGRLIVYTEGRAQPRRNDYATATGHWEKANLYVLVNEYSASASEIVTGAIQDNDRGVVIGRRTFGKGLVQRPIELRDGSVVRLTTARYYTPAGRCIQKPYNGKDREEYGNDIHERYARGEFMSADSIHFSDSLRYETLQLHRTIYGGGGIMPDIFVPFDSTRGTNYHTQLLAKDAINKVVSRYVFANSAALREQYANAEEYRNNYVVPESLLQEIIEEGKKAGVEYNEEQWGKSVKLIALQVKALIVRNVWGNSEYYKVMSEVNEPLQEALKVIREGRMNNYLSGKKETETKRQNNKNKKQ